MRILTKEIREITGNKIRRRGSKYMTTTSSKRKAYKLRMHRTSIKSYMGKFLNMNLQKRILNWNLQKNPTAPTSRDRKMTTTSIQSWIWQFLNSNLQKRILNLNWMRQFLNLNLQKRILNRNMNSRRRRISISLIVILLPHLPKTQRKKRRSRRR